MYTPKKPSIKLYKTVEHKKQLESVIKTQRLPSKWQKISRQKHKWCWMINAQKLYTMCAVFIGSWKTLTVYSVYDSKHYAQNPLSNCAFMTGQNIEIVQFICVVTGLVWSTFQHYNSEMANITSFSLLIAQWQECYREGCKSQKFPPENFRQFHLENVIPIAVYLLHLLSAYTAPVVSSVLFLWLIVGLLTGAARMVSLRSSLVPSLSIIFIIRGKFPEISS